MLGKEYQTHDVPALEIAFHNIANWYDYCHSPAYALSFDFGLHEVKVRSRARYNN